MRTVTSSYDAGRRYLNEALVRFIETMDDRRSSTSNIEPADYSEVLPTTWAQLAKRGMVKVEDMNAGKYEVTPLGYSTALKISIRSDSSQIRGRIGRLYRVRKDSFKRT
jgi:hypothetical protein